MSADSAPPAVDPTDEEALLARILAGEREAAGAIAARTYRLVWRALHRLTAGDEELASELTQETYRKAWQALPGFDGRARFSTWLYRIAYTTFLNRQRRPRLVEASADPEDRADAVAGPERRAIESEEAARIRRAVLALSEPYRFTVTARFWADRSVREIASVEGVTVVAVRKRLARAFDLIRAQLEEDQ